MFFRFRKKSPSPPASTPMPTSTPPAKRILNVGQCRIDGPRPHHLPHHRIPKATSSTPPHMRDEALAARRPSIPMTLLLISRLSSTATACPLGTDVYLPPSAAPTPPSPHARLRPPHRPIRSRRPRRHQRLRQIRPRLPRHRIPPPLHPRALLIIHPDPMCAQPVVYNSRRFYRRFAVQLTFVIANA